MRHLDLADDPRESHESSASRRKLHAKVFGVTVPAQSAARVAVSMTRYRGHDPDALCISEIDEKSFVSLLLAQGLFPWFTAQFELAAMQTTNVGIQDWWKAIELDRKHHLPRLLGVEPRRPGDLDLVLGPWSGRPFLDWLVGVEMKRLKFSELGVRKGRLTQIDDAVDQAKGLWALGFDQAALALLVVIQPEDLPIGVDGSAARADVHEHVVQRLRDEIRDRVPDEIGVLGVLWDAPPNRSPQRESDVTLYKFRRPRVSPRRSDIGLSGHRLSLDDALLRILGAASPRSPFDVVRACPFCQRPVLVRSGTTRGCPDCHRAWAALAK